MENLTPNPIDNNATFKEVSFDSMDKLQQLIIQCKCCLSINVNEHRSTYENIKDYLNQQNSLCELDIDKDIKNKIIELDNLIEITVFPNTPVAHYVFYHYDLIQCIDQAYKIIIEGNIIRK